jgi:hypothetical protein
VQDITYGSGEDIEDMEDGQGRPEDVEEDNTNGPYKLFLLQFAEVILDYTHYSEDSPPEKRQAFKEAEKWLINPKAKLYLAGEKFTFPEAVSFMLDLPMDSLEFQEQFAELKKKTLQAGTNYSCYLENKKNLDCGGSARRCGSCPRFNGKENYDPRSILFPPIRPVKKKKKEN